MNLKRIVVPALAAAFCCVSLHAASFRATRAPSVHLGAPKVSLHGPALQGGFGLSGRAVPRLQALALTPSVIPAASALSADVPARPGAFASAQVFARRLGEGNADQRDISGGAFDGSSNGGGDGLVSADGSPLHQLYPKVVFLQDVFAGPASETVVAYVEKLLAAGTHVVFMTSRPLKGAGSAEEVLMGRVKAHRDNPVIVVSYNGGKVSIHGRAANPKSVIEDAGAFPAADLEVFKAIDAKVGRTMSGGLKSQAQPAADAAFSYVVEVPAAKTRAKLLARYNRALQDAGLPYRMEPHPENPFAIITYSMPLRFSLPRVLSALDEVFHGEKLAETPGKFLILADSRRSPKFSTAFPKQAEVQVVGSGAGVEDILGAVLGDRKLAPVSVNLSKLRQFVEYWDKRGARRGDGAGAGVPGAAKKKKSSSGDRLLSGYVTNVMNKLLADFYDDLRRSQSKAANLPALMANLRRFWYDPFNNGVWAGDKAAFTKFMRGADWKAMNRGYFGRAESFLMNFYTREFGNYGAAAADVRSNLVSLNQDALSLTTLEFVSASTGKLYKIHTRIPRVMKRDTADGVALTAYAYRTGPEQTEEEARFFARILGMALLKAHGKLGPDGTWRYRSSDGPRIATLNVQLEFMSGHLTWTLKPEEVMEVVKNEKASGTDAPAYLVRQGPIANEITSAIEREEADLEFQKYHEEQEKKDSPAPSKKKKRNAR